MNANETLRNLSPLDIQQYQQNRFPCFFIDCIEEAIPGESAQGYKNFTYNEWFFPAHFEDEPVVPGFILIETLTQVFLMSFLTLMENKGKKTGFLSVKNANFKKKVVPGNRLDIKAKLTSYRRGIATGSATGFVNGEVVCQIELSVAVPDILHQFIPR